MDNELQLTSFVTPSLTDAIERTLAEAQKQGVDLNELKDEPRIPVNKQFSQDKLEELVDLKSKGSPIAGQSLTNEKEAPYPWEQPPEFSNPQIALNSIVKKLIEKEPAGHLLDAIHQGTSIIDLSSIILYSGFTEGKWSPDTMMLLMEPVMYTLMHFAEEAGIDYIIDKKGNNEPDDDEDNLTSKDITTMQGIKQMVVNKKPNSTVLPNEVKSTITKSMPSILERTT